MSSEELWDGDIRGEMRVIDSCDSFETMRCLPLLFL